MTKSFGEFQGGLLKYWADDDGTDDVEDLNDAGASAYDTHRQIVLFDGLRCHAVTSFEGERYSLVFFTAPDFMKARPATIHMMEKIGATWPNEVSQKYYRNLLAPPKGNCKSIRQMFGYEEKQAAIQPSGTALTALSDTSIYNIISFVITPQKMTTISALSTKFRQMTFNPQSWTNAIIDTSGLKPIGKQSHTHYKFWTQAKHIVNGAWACSNVGLLMSKEYKTWTW